MKGDPRLGDEYVRLTDGDGENGDVVLVGVVHDHPASVHRVHDLVRSEAPAVVALELAPLALPLFAQYAAEEADGTDEQTGERTADAVGEQPAERDDRSRRDDGRYRRDHGRSTPPPRRGGEMSAAIHAAATDRIAAIDGPSRGFLRRLARTLLDENPSRADLRRVVSRFAAVSRHVLVCRLAALVGRATGTPPDVHQPTDHDVTRFDPPGAQAADERTQVRKATAVLSAFESPTHARVRDETREAHMAARLRSLRAEGDVVAVVGHGHLDAVHERLADD